jgi:hypothetical protein
MKHKAISNFKDVDRVLSLEQELACYYAGIAVLLEECYARGAGVRALGLRERSDYVRLAPEIDVKTTDIGRLLPVWARYAYEGVIGAGYGPDDMDACEGSLERLSDMLHLLRDDDPYFQLCLEAAEMDLSASVEFGGLKDLVERVAARHALDMGGRLNAAALALLSNMSERSVRNAMLAGGDLEANSEGYVENAEALRWLHGRRGFVPTTKRLFPIDTNELPDALDAVEIPPFIYRRLKAVWGQADSQESTQFDARYPAWVMQAAHDSGVPPERILAGCELPLDIRPADCDMWAKALRVDRVWLTHQVLSAMFAEQVDMLLNPQAWTAPQNDVQKAITSAVTITLTRAMLEHGYVDMPASASSMFPDDSMGSRKEGDTGMSVVFFYGSHRAETDIRIKSSKTISPRKRFGAWLNDELNAREGDRIRIEKTGEREYTLSHLVAESSKES